MNGQTTFGTRRIARAGLMMAGMVLLTGCGMRAGSATESAICRELRADLPSWSQRDTPETLASGARFVAVFDAVCG